MSFQTLSNAHNLPSGAALPSVTVVIPTVGRPSLRRTVEAATSQTIPTQVVVVLARPTVEHYVRELLGQLPHELVVSDEGIGASAARNVGVEHARGSYVAFCDDDDWWLPQKLERQLDALVGLGDERCLILTSMFFHRRSGKIVVLPRRYPHPDESIADYMVVRSRLRFGEGVVQSSSFFAKTELFREVPWDITLPVHQDWDLAIRLANEHGIQLSFVPEPLVHVTQGSPGSVSSMHGWEASSVWLTRHSAHLSRRARGDFTAVMVLRRALAGRDRRGVAKGIRGVISNPPHLAALSVAIAGGFSR